MNGFDIAKSANKCLPICVPSYHRFDLKENKTLRLLLESCDEKILGNTFIFVRKEEYDKYKKLTNKVNFIELPEVEGLSDTRQYIVDFVSDELCQDLFIDADDDIVSLTYTEIRDKKPKVSAVDRSKTQQMLNGISAVGEYLANSCDVVISGVRKQRFSNNAEYVHTAAKVNKGNTPRQLMVISTKKLKERGVKRNPIFNKTGDDVGFVAEIARHKMNFASIVCFHYSYVDDQINSVIRNDSNRKSLARYEYECLKKYPMGKKYLRIPHRFDDGSYKFSDIDFGKYRKQTGVPTFDVSVKEVVNWLK